MSSKFRDIVCRDFDLIEILTVRVLIMTEFETVNISMLGPDFQAFNCQNFSFRIMNSEISNTSHLKRHIKRLKFEMKNEMA